MKRLAVALSAVLAGLALACAACAPDAVYAANLTPDQLTQETTPATTDIMVIYPIGGPLKGIQWSSVKSAITGGLGAIYLQVSNNLNDVASPSSARNNLGLGTAAVQNIGTSGANVPLLNGLNTWGASQTFVVGTATVAPVLFQAGTNLTAPVAGAAEWDGTNLYLTQTTGPTRKTVAYIDSAITGSAAKWTTARTIAITGDLAYTSPSLDGSANVTAASTLATVNANVGSFLDATVTVNAKGLVTAASGIQTAMFVQQETSGTASPDGCVVTTWCGRAITSAVVNTITGASFSSPSITLPAGTFEIWTMSTMDDSNNTTTGVRKARWRNTTDSTTPISGVNGPRWTTGGTLGFNNNLSLFGQFTIASSKTFSLQGYSTSGWSGGHADSSGDVETYVIIYIRKIG